ncbi:MAG: metallophosphoesterase [Oscillospiraceae bacterium]|nr:metallophosphoesterase [Oscillospiraceae bacterium]
MSRKRRRRVRIFPILLLLFVLVIGILLFDSNTRLVTTEYELHFANLPAGFDGFRIVVLSDIHAAVFGENNERLIEMVKEAEPDIIAITGDFIDSYGRLNQEQQLEVAENIVIGIKPIAPVFYITGNHEWVDGGIWPLLEILREHDVHVLRNRFTRLYSGGDMIVLAGTDDPNGPADMIKPDEFVRRIREEEPYSFIVMLEHRNHNLELYSELGVDLVLSGHAHGGYIRLPFTDGLLGTQRDWFPSYTSGVYTRGNTKMLVSRGIGNHLPIPRFLNNPEIVVAVLRAG